MATTTTVANTGSTVDTSSSYNTLLLEIKNTIDKPIVSFPSGR